MLQTRYGSDILDSTDKNSLSLGRSIGSANLVCQVPAFWSQTTMSSENVDYFNFHFLF